jgi:hypothetical protein
LSVTLQKTKEVKALKIKHLASVLILIFLMISLMPQNSLPRANSSQVNWASLHGVNYLWAPYLVGWNPQTLDPATSFPQMKANGWNLIRVAISWTRVIQNQSAYVSALKEVANEADANGLYVIYNNEVSVGTGWPDCVFSQYSTPTNFYAAWWANQVICNGDNNPSENGVNGWQASWNQFWIPTIQTVDSHVSTLGYEIMNEPPVAPSGETQQTFNQWFYNQVRTVSSKAVVFDPPYGNPGGGGGPIKGTQAAQNVMPNGNGLVLDYHDYGVIGSALDADVSQWANVSGLSGYFMGEFGIDYPTNFSSALNYFSCVYPTLNKYGAGSAVFAWMYSNTGAYSLLTPTTLHQNFVDTAIVQAYNNSSSTTVCRTTSGNTSSQYVIPYGYFLISILVIGAISLLYFFQRSKKTRIK